MCAYFARQAEWFDAAVNLKPTIITTTIKPVGIVEAKPDASAFQGWRMQHTGEYDAACTVERGRSWEVIYDFGDHYVGHLNLMIELVGVVDCPLRLRVIFGEVPSEVAEDFNTYDGVLGRGWLQEELLVIDELPVTLRLPRRYAFRYVKLVAELNSPYYKMRIAEVSCEAESSADARKVSPLSQTTKPSLQQIDRIALKTLQDCMQSVFEDGPKRDRRLWLGDMRLQALSNYKSFRNYTLVKRCLLYFAALCDGNGRVPTDIYEKGLHTLAGTSNIFDYVAVYADCLLEYARASGDWKLAEELWPVAARQAEIVLSEKGADGLFQNIGKWWCFIDWHSSLEKMTAEQGVAIYGLKKTRELAQGLGRKVEAAALADAIREMSAAAVNQLYDKASGYFVSGPAKQVSVATQIWMILAGVIEGVEAARLLKQVLADPASLKPVSPYLHHHLVHALMQVGLGSDAIEHIERYWGAMAELGADTFWEVFVPGDDTLSPYKSHIMNSYCHAWSCTPVYFLRE